MEASFLTKVKGDKRSLKNEEELGEDREIVLGTLRVFSTLQSRNSFCSGQLAGSRNTTVFIFVKLLYLLNAFGQLYLLNAFMGRSGKPGYWGTDVLYDVLYGIPWETSGHFPRVTMCQFDVRRMGTCAQIFCCTSIKACVLSGNVHRFYSQCVLKFNMVNEKMFGSIPA